MQGDMCSVPGLGRSHAAEQLRAKYTMTEACMPLEPVLHSREAAAGGDLSTTMKGNPNPEKAQGSNKDPV